MKLAQNKNRSIFGWGFATFLFVPCVLVLALLPEIKNNQKFSETVCVDPGRDLERCKDVFKNNKNI